MSKLIYRLAENEQDIWGIHDVRRQVFVREQGIPQDLVFLGDGSGNELNMVVKDGDTVIGTARIQIMGSMAKIERMAVLKPFRNKGIGKGIIAFLSEQLKHRDIDFIFLHAQHAAVDFYRSCGFSESGSPFYEVGIKHVKMEMEIEY